MVSALRQKVVVRKGGIVEVRSPDLPEGATAEVIVLLEGRDKAAEGERPLVSLRSLIGSCKGMFSSPEEADRFISHERDSWGR